MYYVCTKARKIIFMSRNQAVECVIILEARGIKCSLLRDGVYEEYSTP